MSRVFLFAFLLFSVFSAADVLEKERSGDQLYQDEFSSLAWQKYYEAYQISNKSSERIRLLEKLSKTAGEAKKASETIGLIRSMLSKVKNLELETRSSLLLNQNLLFLETAKFKEAAAVSNSIIKNLSKLSKSLQSKVLDTALYAFIKNSELEKASKLIEENLKLFADPAKAELQNARIKILLNQFVSAISILEKFAESKETLPHFLSMWAYLKSGDTAKSYEIYGSQLKALTSVPDPAFTGVLIKLAESTYKDKLKESMEVLNKALLLEQNKNLQAYIYLKKSELLILAGNDVEAIAALEDFLKVFPKSNKVLQASLQLAELYFNNENQDLVKAASYLNSVIDANPEDSKMMYDALVLRAGVKLAAGTLTDAAGDFTTAAELAKKHKFTADLITHPLYSAGLAKYTEAEKGGVKEAYNDAANSFYSAASVKSSFRLKAALMQVQALRRAGNYNVAVQNLQNWLKIFPKSPDLLYLHGLSLLEDKKTSLGLKALKRFSIMFPKDQRVAMTFVHALRASIYDVQSAKLKKSCEDLISGFEQKLQLKGELQKPYQEAAPHVLHLKAIFAWKHNHKTAAVKYWNDFLTTYESHPLAAEVYLWLAFKVRTSQNPDFTKAEKFYTSAVSTLPENSLKAYSLTQLGKTLGENGSFTRASESLSKAIQIYKGMKLDEKLTEELATLLFYSGDLYSRMGLYEDQAAVIFAEALNLSSSINVKLAIKGRIADCIFSHAGKLSGQDDQTENFESNIKKALEIYKEIAYDKNASVSIREQALYKLAKCHETLGNLKDKTHTNKHLALAVDTFKELFFAYYNDLKSGKKRDPYYFCRTGYDLARLHLNFEEPAIIPAINTYKILFESRFPGTAQAGEMLKFLNAAQKKIDNE